MKYIRMWLERRRHKKFCDVDPFTITWIKSSPTGSTLRICKSCADQAKT